MIIDQKEMPSEELKIPNPFFLAHGYIRGLPHITPTDRKILYLLLYGGLITTVGMYFLFALWPLSNLILGTQHSVSLILFKSTYLALDLGLITVMTAGVFGVFKNMANLKNLLES